MGINSNMIVLIQPYDHNYSNYYAALSSKIKTVISYIAGGNQLRTVYLKEVCEDVIDMVNSGNFIKIK